MDVMRDTDGELVFLYQLKEGSTNTSYACHIATIAGIPKEIVTRGNEVLDSVMTKFLTEILNFVMFICI